MDRPGWNRLTDAVRAGRVSKVVVWRLDRLGRTAKGADGAVRRVTKARVNLVSLRDSIDSVTVVDGNSGASDWVFDHDVTATDVPTNFLIDSAAPRDFAQVNATTIRLNYESPVEGLEWSAEGTTNLTLPADHYLCPGQLGTVAG